MHQADDKSSKGQQPALRMSPPVVRFLVVAAFVATAVFYAVVFAPWEPCKTYEALRGSLFTGFFTVSGFLLSMKSFVIQQLKKDVYDQEAYLLLLAKRRTQMRRADTHYGSLQDLSSLFIYAIVTCLASSLVQITIGLVHRRWAIGVCFAAAGVGFVAISFIIFHIRRNLLYWFEFLEKNSKHNKSAADG